MSVTFRLRTSLLDAGKERTNPHNPIAGESILLWLAEAGVALSRPEPEDWGWYSTLEWTAGRRYMVGASFDDGEWTVQVEKIRSAREKLFGQAKMSSDDACAAHIGEVLRRLGEVSR
ncbi:hypothetical protein F183_A15580 [Bryobacterales bacterium F-183]|nr:hypothetical protein F183_A15580 [Bryobacterales bacterium F-183]